MPATLTAPPERSVTIDGIVPQQRGKFRFRGYQREDLARAALHDGAILAWDPGLGKTMAMFAWPYLKGAKRTLIVAPAALHAQIIREGREKFGVTVTVIRDQADAYRLMRQGDLPFPGCSTENSELKTENSGAMPRYYITDYRWLGYNGADEMIEANSVQREARIPVVAGLLGVAPGELPGWFFDHEQAAPVIVKQMLKKLPAKVAAAYPKVREWQSGIGVSQSRLTGTGESHAITCCFTPSLSTLIGDCFDCAVCDEAVRLKSGTESYIARGVMGLRAKFRLALTGTPIKNRLPDIFFLATWVCHCGTEAASARFPYGNTISHRNGFAANHLVQEENLTKTEQSRREGSFRRFVKQVNKLTNVHRLWKLLGPVVVRRRKDDIGEDIVPKRIVPVKVMPGAEQLSVYRWHMENPPVCATKVAALGAQLQYLRQAALCPWTSCLPHTRAASHWSPKMAAILNLAADLMEKGEQLVVFSPFQDFSTALQRRFREAGVDSLLLDGRVNNVKRGEHAQAFKDRKQPVLIAGIASMGEGHSFECASHLVLPSLSWAYDENAQAIERVHRLTSRKDVTIYALVTRGTIDERLAQIFDEKGDASDLALDGRLFEDDREEVSLAELLHSARLSFDAHAETLDEGEVEQEWSAILKPRLGLASQTFKRTSNIERPTSDIELAADARSLAATPAVSLKTENSELKTTSNVIEFPGLFAPAEVETSALDVRRSVSNVPSPAPSAMVAAPVTRKTALARLAAAFG